MSAAEAAIELDLLGFFRRDNLPNFYIWKLYPINLISKVTIGNAVHSPQMTPLRPLILE